MADQEWSNVPVGMPDGCEPWENSPKPKKRTGWMIGAAAAVLVAVAAVAVVFALKAVQNTDQMLANAWEKTSEALARRGDGQPLQAMGAAAAQSESGTFRLDCSDLEIDGTLLCRQIGLEAASDGENTRLLLELALEDGVPLDVSFYSSEGLIGLGSEAILGDDMIYTVEPGSLEAQARGGIFDPDTGAYPLDAQMLSELDALFQAQEPAFDLEGMEAAVEELKEEYRDFVECAEGEKSSGKLPGSGEKATVLTYVYTADQMIGLLETMGDTVFSSQGFLSYFDYLAQQGGDFSADSMENGWNEVLETLRQSYSGDITVSYYLSDGKVAFLQMDAAPAFDGERVSLHAEVDLGLESGVLTADISMEDGVDRIGMSLRSEQGQNEGVAFSDWTLSLQENGTEAGFVSGGSSWDHDSGELESRFSVGAQGTELLTLEGTGVLAADDTAYALEYDSLTLAADGAAIRCGLQMRYDSSAAVTEPERQTAFFAMTEEEFLGLMLAIQENVERISAEMSGAYDAEQPEWGLPEEPESASGLVTPLEGYTYMGLADCGGQSVWIPAVGDVEDYGDMLSVGLENLSVSVSVYETFGADAGETLEWLTSYWGELEGENIELVSVSDIQASGNKAARTLVYDYGFDGWSIRNSLASFAELRDGMVILTEVSLYPEYAGGEDIALLQELDQLLQMPLRASELLS